MGRAMRGDDDQQAGTKAGGDAGTAGSARVVSAVATIPPEGLGELSQAVADWYQASEARRARGRGDADGA